ncbi:MAG: 30S ribosomal protein S6 [Candidatus Omnitrophota bacterium]|nr:30S ribosomal protein S6 [Candidatus Omnitrophota bacterium]
MAKYELMFITKTGLRDEEKEAILKQVAEPITKNEGKVIKKDLWLDKHRLTYSIKKQKEGTYFLVELVIDKGAIIKLNQALRLNENILRFQIVKLE